MKLVSFSSPEASSFGVLKGARVVCLPTLAKFVGQQFPSGPEILIEEGNHDSIESMLQNSTRRELETATYPVSQVRLHAPIRKPPKIICLGLNYKDHAAEQGKTPPDEPVIFMKPNTAIIGTGENIIKPDFVKQLDYEAELAIVIGKGGKNISVKEAKSCIFGYTILNDVSARDIQFKDRQWTRGKSFDTFAPTGPCITTTAQIQNPTNLRIRTWVNKQLRQNSTTRNMTFNVFEIVQHLSRVMTLEPCDIIATGTPAGVGFAMKPEPKFLQDGDVVTIEIEGVGILRNKVREEQIPRSIYG
jgi:2-keto-4-pentenoate hydratase/2-oxohepta-3-ene-1,7-dioic acid hydratase in catechol pathway